MEKAAVGRISSLHAHPAVAGEPLIAVSEFNVVADQGIREDARYFGRVNREGKPSRRQISLIEREVISGHAAALGAEFSPGEARSNIETEGIDLVALIGREIQAGEAVLKFVSARTPCAKMDELAPGLRELMENGRQGVMAMVVQSGRIRPGDSIRAISSGDAEARPETS